MAFITDITAIIDEDEVKDSINMMKILKPYAHQKQGSLYVVHGTYEELEDISYKLRGVKSVDVSEAAMAYIHKKCTRELSEVQGDSFVIEPRLDDRTVRCNHARTLQVTLKPRLAAITPVQADLARQRFVTFYQRTVSDLQVTSISGTPRQHVDLQRRFPQLLFNASGNDACNVTGPFAAIARLNEFLWSNASSSSRSPASRGTTDGSKTSDPLPERNKDEEEELCPICMDPIVSARKETLRCKHSFCKDCLKKAFAYKPVCPTCGELYGTLTGTQPDGGTMNAKVVGSRLPGYEKYGTIVIEYYIPSGIQMEEHPNPGQPYEGVSRTAYLPDSSEGRRILKLLQRAFDQKLVFTVGRSTTSGRNNMVTWNDIHHKTSTHGGPTHYGYPDPDYLTRVCDELKVKGIE